MTSNANGTERTHDEYGTRVAFVDRALETVRRMADSVDEPRLQRALDADTDDAVLTALGLRRTSASALVQDQATFSGMVRRGSWVQP